MTRPVTELAASMRPTAHRAPRTAPGPAGEASQAACVHSWHSPGSHWYHSDPGDARTAVPLLVEYCEHCGRVRMVNLAPLIARALHDGQAESSD